MNRYLRQYEEAKNGGHLDEDGNVILINSRGVPVLPTYWLKIEFAIVNFFSKLTSLFLDFKGRIFEI